MAKNQACSACGEKDHTAENCTMGNMINFDDEKYIRELREIANSPE